MNNRFNGLTVEQMLHYAKTEGGVSPETVEAIQLLATQIVIAKNRVESDKILDRKREVFENFEVWSGKIEIIEARLQELSSNIEIQYESNSTPKIKEHSGWDSTLTQLDIDANSMADHAVNMIQNIDEGLIFLNEIKDFFKNGEDRWLSKENTYDIKPNLVEKSLDRIGELLDIIGNIDSEFTISYNPYEISSADAQRWSWIEDKVNKIKNNIADLPPLSFGVR